MRLRPRDPAPQDLPAWRSGSRRFREKSIDFLRPLRLDDEVSHSMAKRGALSTAGVLAQSVTRFVTNVVIGRIGGPLVLGSVASGIATGQLLALLGPTSAGNAASKFIARARGKGSATEAAAVARHLRIRATQTTVVLAVLAVPIWIYVDKGESSGAAAIAALVLGYSGYSFTRGVQYGAGLVARATAWDLLTSALGMLGVVVALLLGVRGIYVVVPLAAAYGVYTLAGWPWHTRGVIEEKLRREIDLFILLGVAGTVSSAGFMQSSVILARISGGSGGAGQYAAALVLATPASLLAMSLSLVLFPSMSEAWGRRDIAAFKTQTDRASRALVVAMTGVLGVLAICSPAIVRIVWGREFEDASRILPILLLAVLANTVSVACTNALTTRSTRGVATSTVSSVAGMLIGIVSWVVFVPRFGAEGVALGYLLGALVIAVVPIVIVTRRDGHKWTGLWIRLLAGLTVLLVILVVDRRFVASRWMELPEAVVFVAGWLLLVRRDLLIALNRRR